MLSLPLGSARYRGSISCTVVPLVLLTAPILPPSSPSQGPCCTPECSYKGRNEKCRDESECAHQGMCNGVTAMCPTSEPKANFTACHGETQVCLNGVSRGRAGLQTGRPAVL